MCQNYMTVYITLFNFYFFLNVVLLSIGYCSPLRSIKVLCHAYATILRVVACAENWGLSSERRREGGGGGEKKKKLAGTACQIHSRSEPNNLSHRHISPQTISNGAFSPGLRICLGECIRLCCPRDKPVISYLCLSPSSVLLSPSCNTGG